MNLALLMPDWDSLDSVRKAHSSLELWSIWLFAGLVVFDVVAHLIEDRHRSIAKWIERVGLLCFAFAVVAELAAYKYGQRNDALSEQVIFSLDAKAKNALVDASSALTKAGEANTKSQAADSTAGDAQRKVEAVRREADRIGGTLSMAVGLINARRVERGDKLAAEFDRRFNGRKIQLVSYAGDIEGWTLCQQLLNVAKEAKMIPEDICGKAWFTNPLITPLSITAPNWDDEQSIAMALLNSGHIGSTGTIGPNLIIFVGVKSPFIIGDTDQTRDAAKRVATMKKAQAAKKNR
jgi:hypothetical protein